MIDSGYRTTEVRLGDKESRRISNLSCKGRDKDRGISKIVAGVQRRFDTGWVSGGRNIEPQLYE